MIFKKLSKKINKISTQPTFSSKNWSNSWKLTFQIAKPGMILTQKGIL